MLAFDVEILRGVNAVAGASPVFDTLVGFVSGNHLVKGGVPMALFWWAWFTASPESRVRARLLSTLAACIVAMVTARLLAASLPFRTRPLHHDGLDFVIPYGMSRSTLDGWSAFPSDHAVLFFALATGICCAARRTGAFLLAYTVLLIALPRIYLGLHYPSDIIAGGLLGALIALLLQHARALAAMAPVQRWSVKRPGLFYALLFLLSYQVADLFNNTRSFLKLAEILLQLK